MKVHSLLKAAVLSLALSGPATAAVYTGIWDPLFGAGPFSADFAWRGQALFSVPDACEVANGTVNNVDDCGGAAVVTSATVQLYDDDLGPVFGLLGTIVFNPASITIATLQYVAGDVDQLVTTTLSAPQTTTLEAGVVPANYGFAAATTFSLSFTATGPRLYFNCTGVAPESCAGVNNDGAGFRPDFNISRVPEPASLVLSGLALAGLLTLRRRRGTSPSV